MRVFISYTTRDHRDRALVQRITDELEVAELTHYDRGSFSYRLVARKPCRENTLESKDSRDSDDPDDAGAGSDKLSETRIEARGPKSHPQLHPSVIRRTP